MPVKKQFLFITIPPPQADVLLSKHPYHTKTIIGACKHGRAANKRFHEHLLEIERMYF